MFNALGIYSVTPPMLMAYARPIQQPIHVAVQSSNSSGIGGAGNDVINIGGEGPPGPPGPPGPQGTISPVPVTQVTTSQYAVLPTDYFICVMHEGPVIITLPTGVLGAVYIIKDCSGTASVLVPIIIQGNFQDVDGSTARIDAPYGSVTLIFNGTEWSLV